MKLDKIFKDNQDELNTRSKERIQRTQETGRNLPSEEYHKRQGTAWKQHEPRRTVKQSQVYADYRKAPQRSSPERME